MGPHSPQAPSPPHGARLCLDPCPQTLSAPPREEVFPGHSSQDHRGMETAFVWGERAAGVLNNFSHTYYGAVLCVSHKSHLCFCFSSGDPSAPHNVACLSTLTIIQGSNVFDPFLQISLPHTMKDSLSPFPARRISAMQLFLVSLMDQPSLSCCLYSGQGMRGVDSWPTAPSPSAQVSTLGPYLANLSKPCSGTAQQTGKQ